MPAKEEVGNRGKREIEKDQGKGNVDTMDIPGLQQLTKRYMVFNASMKKEAIEENTKANSQIYKKKGKGQ